MDHLLEHFTLQAGLAHFFWGEIISAITAAVSFTKHANAKKAKKKATSKSLLVGWGAVAVLIYCVISNKPKSESGQQAVTNQSNITLGANSPILNLGQSSSVSGSFNSTYIINVAPTNA